MSVLDRIAVIEEALKSILTVLEENKGKLDKLLGWAAPYMVVKTEGGPKKELEPLLQQKLREGREKIEELEKKNGKEEVAQDLAEVLITKETEKAFLVVKHGFQVWVAKSHLQDPEGYDLGNTYDLKVKDKSKWVLKNLEWKPFEVFKN